MWRRDLPLLAVVVVAAVAGAGIGAAAMGGLDRISQTYDGLFHLNAAAWILDTGDASSFHLYQITHPGDGNEFYPAAWHALVAGIVQLSGCGIPTATNVAWIATSSAIWTPGVAALAAQLAPAARGRLAAAAAAVLSVGATGFPLLLLAWGTLYPTGLAYTLLPTGLILTVRLCRWVLGRTRHRLPVRISSLMLAVSWLLGAAFAHPRSMFSLLVIAVPLLVVTAATAVSRLWTHRGLRRRIVIMLGSVAALVVGVGTVGVIYVYRAFNVAARPISDHLNGGPATARQGPLPALLQGVGLAPLDPRVDTVVLAPAIGIAALAAVGAVFAARRRGQRWLLAAWLVSLLLWVLASGSNSDLAKVLTGVWYKDKFRLFPLIALTALLLATLTITVFADAVLRRTRTPERRRTVLVAVVVATAVIATAGAQLPSTSSSVAAVFRLPNSTKSGALLDRDEYRLLARLDRTVPAGDIVVGDPWDGSALSWAIGSRRSLFPHLAGVWSPDAVTIAQRLDQAAVDPEVCAAVNRLDAHWVVHDPELLWGQPAEAQFWAGIDRAVATPGLLTEVDAEGSSRLYRVSICDAPNAG
ncbi:hypothetical protein FJ658_05090 [Schumannella sp. 10F1B-5-1]|nr:hypothetical protein FJ658_05090 [Schumannella sp. 10F1B-5-1]